MLFFVYNSYNRRKENIIIYSYKYVKWEYGSATKGNVRHNCILKIPKEPRKIQHSLNFKKTCILRLYVK